MSQVSTLQQTFNQNLVEFLQESPTPYHAVKNMVAQLEQHGFQQLHESEAWQLKDNGRYYVTRNDSFHCCLYQRQPSTGLSHDGRAHRLSLPESQA